MRLLFIITLMMQEDLRTMTLVADRQRWIGLRRTEGSMDDTWDWTWQDGSLFSHTV